MKKKKYYLLTGLPLLYFLLILLLYRAEVGAPGSKIQNFSDVIWYSIVTLSTVGYGDMTPVTTGGRVISAIFLLLSAGVMVTVLGTMFSFLSGEAFPMFRLQFQRRKNWYYFADYGIEALTMAENIRGDEPEAVIIFGEKPGEQDTGADFPCYYLQSPLQLIIRCKAGAGEPCQVFFMKENGINASAGGRDIQELPVRAYARTSNGQDQMVGNVRFFHTYECCARTYWQTHPLHFEERSIVLIGFGAYGQNLLERAILTNVIREDQTVTYHIFGEAGNFLQMHDHLQQMFDIYQQTEGSEKAAAASKPGRDALVFHADSWEASGSLLRQADRIIICMDKEDVGWEIYWNLRKFYRIRAQIDVRSSRPAPGISVFGTIREIYTPRQILRQQLNASAIAMNEIYRKSTPGPTLSWDELSEFMRQSKIAAADHLLVKARILLGNEDICEVSAAVLHNAAAAYRHDLRFPGRIEAYRRLEHLRWCRFYAFHNWENGRETDRTDHIHPMLVAYEELTEKEAAHHDHAWELLEELADTQC